MTMRPVVLTLLLVMAWLGSVDTARAAPILDPMGDAVAIFGVPGPLIDLASLSVRVVDGNILVSAQFHAPILPASSGAPNSLAGGMDFDFDRDPLTGDPPFQNNFPPLTALVFGSDISVDFFTESLTPGFANVFENTTHTHIGQVPVTFTSDRVAYVLPLALVPFSGRFDVTAGFGTLDQPTDALDVRATVPEPAPWVLLFAGLLARVIRRGDSAGEP